MGISQQTLAHYEVRRFRIAVSTLLPLEEILKSSVDELVKGKAAKDNGKRGRASRLQQQIGQVARLPKTKQKFVSEMLETVIQQGTY